MRRVTFRGRKLLLIGTKKHGGALATERQYAGFLPSYAHLFPDGSVRRFGHVIGHRDQIKARAKPSPANRPV